MAKAEVSSDRGRRPSGIGEDTDSSRLQVIDAAIVDHRETAAAASPCPACGSPRDLNDRFCVACGIPFAVPGERSPNEGLPNSLSPINAHSVHCESCGANFEVTEKERSYACPFCDSNVVVDRPASTEPKRMPEFIIGFAINRAEATRRFEEWLKKNSWFRPSDLFHKALADRIKGVYLPFWHFSMIAESDWSAQIGEYWYRTETYTTRDAQGRVQTHTRQVRETEWWPLSGNHHRYYSGFLVSASRGLPQNEALSIQPFDLNALTRYRPYFLAGWYNEEYSIQPSDAIAVAEEEFRKRERMAIERLQPGDTFSNLRVATRLTSTGSDLILLPVHIISYHYRGRVFRFLVNGQTGKVYGSKPWSSVRIALAITFGVLLFAAIALAIAYANR